MLANLDVLIGLAVIMLGLSLIVTVANQAVSAALGLRGMNLKWGLSVLVQELHRDRFRPPETKVPFFGNDLNEQAADAVDQVLRHRLVSDSRLPRFWWRRASAIRFDEFLKVIHLLGEQTGGAAPLAWLRENHRITEPWFNSVMDRTTQRFAVQMRAYSVVIATLLAVGIGMDTLHIVRVLRADAAMRSGLVGAAGSLSQASGLTEDDRANLQNVAKSIAAAVPRDQGIDALLFRPFNPFGMLLSVVLLSLGAPFWFTALKNLTGLRSVVARKEEQERRGADDPDVGDRIRVRSF